MTLLIDLSETLEKKVKEEAKKYHRTPESLIADIVAKAFEDEVSSVAEVVARIKATPPNPAMVKPPQGSLAEALRNGPVDPDFDIDEWRSEWAVAEEELKRINLLNDLAEKGLVDG